jgi:uncharacterized protein (TIGR00159 family)
MNPLLIITNLRIQDVLDILFLTMVAYYLYVWFWGTKAFKALVGLLALGVVFTIAQFWGLFLTTWAFQILWQVLVVLLIILFQSEIRQVLERVNPLKVIGRRAFPKKNDWVSNLVNAVFMLAERKIGALLILERLDLVDEHVTGGVLMESEPTLELLLSIFQKESPLHDGAMLIRNDRVARVSCYLPLSSARGLPEEWGTRHRAAQGLSERCDACILVVSEERGEISLARDAQMIQIKDPEQLQGILADTITPDSPKQTRWDKLRSLLTNRWPVKLGSLAMVGIFWLLLAGQQNFEVSLKLPVDIKNLPANMKVIEPINPEVKITFRGLRKDASTLNKRNIRAELDLSLASVGNRVFRITRDQIVLPNDSVYIVQINPSRIKFKIEK